MLGNWCVGIEAGPTLKVDFIISIGCWKRAISISHSIESREQRNSRNKNEHDTPSTGTRELQDPTGLAGSRKG
jgi:hypothetical protein